MTAISRLKEFPNSISNPESWKFYQYSPSTLARSQSFKSLTAPVEVHKLVQELAKVDGVAKVRAIASRPEDIHWIEFELEPQPETELDYETWDKIQDLVIDCEWGLRDKTNEKWYFQRKVVEKFAKIQECATIVAQSGISYSSDPKYYKQVKSSSNFLVVV
jgi:hypothetical protein